MTCPPSNVKIISYVYMCFIRSYSDAHVFSYLLKRFSEIACTNSDKYVLV